MSGVNQVFRILIEVIIVLNDVNECANLVCQFESENSECVAA